MDKTTLLIVDDLEMNRSIVHKMVGDSYDILEADCGAKALKIIESEKIDIVITDIFMDPMDGYELIQKIRNMDEYKKIPIIAVTESDHASRKKALKAGADDLLYRPLISSILHNRVKGLLFDGVDLNCYKMAYENNPIPFMLYRVIDRPDTPNYRILYMNKTARAIFAPPVAEDLLRTDENPNQLDFILKTFRTGDVQHQVAFDTDANKWLDLTIYPDGNGLIAAMVHDITDEIERQTYEAKANEEEAIKMSNALSDILSNIPAGVMVFRLEGDNFSIIEANAAICNLMDIDASKIREASRDKIVSFIHKEDVPIILDSIAKLNAPGTNVSYEFRNYNRKKSEYVWLSAQAHSKKQPDGKIYVFISYVDITAKKQLMETQMELMLAQKANQAKTEFLSRMSHDMRTPMNGILGLVALMKDKDDVEELKKNLEQIQLSGQYLMNLMNDTLDISRIESGKLELHEKPTDSMGVMKNILGNAQLMAENKDIQLKVIVPPIPKTEWKKVIVDSARLEQILINVISNAIKYTPENGTVEIEMESMVVTDEEVIDKYIIRDNGIGISEEFLPHIYDYFSQEGRINTERQNGTGLGLAIVKQLVDLMNGEITVKSEVNVGTEVTLIMHYKVFNGELEQVNLLPIDSIKGKRILLCEDHPLNAQIATRLLEKVGAKIDLASDGSIGVKMFETADDGYYDVIIMDIRMPVMDGLEATRIIRKSGKGDAKKIPIIAMTANAFDEDIEKCKQAGMDSHLSKPVDTEQLYQTLAKFLK